MAAESLVGAYFERLSELFASLGRELWLLDLTTDFGVPVTVAVSRTHSRVPDDLLMGFGAHLDARIAVSRALTEICQFLPVEGGASRPQRDSTDPVVSRRWIGAAGDDGFGWLEPDLPGRARDFASWAAVGSGDLTECVRWLVAVARRLGLEVLVLDQSRPEAPLPVVKVVVPGLRPWWARFAPGRLYDVPVALGWLEARIEEADLNPSHLFL